MIGVIWAIFRGSLPLQIATAALLAFAAFKANNLYQRHIGATQATAKIARQSEKAGREANAKASKAHDRAQQPGAAERVLKRFCRDCGD